MERDKKTHKKLLLDAFMLQDKFPDDFKSKRMGRLFNLLAINKLLPQEVIYLKNGHAKLNFSLLITCMFGLFVILDIFKLTNIS